MKLTDTLARLTLGILGVLLFCGTVARGQARYVTHLVEAENEQAGGTAFDQSYVRLSTLREFPARLRNVVSLHMSSATLEEALHRVSEQAGLHIIYGQETVAVGKQIHADLEAVPAGEALQEVLRGTGRDLILSRSGQLVLVHALERKLQGAALDLAKHPVRVPEAMEPIRLQMGAIAGTVTDSTTGEPLPGVNVVIAGTQRGASTDAVGHFVIPNLDPGTYDLIASFIGYTTNRIEGVQVTGGDTTRVQIALSSSLMDLEEVVVIGYGTQTRRDMTGAVASVSAEAIEEAHATSFNQALQGRVAGVRVVQSSGAPGAAPVVRIRGRTSIIGNNQPLYVVDGIPIGRGGRGAGNSNPLAAINPNNIASIEVLKGPSAAAIYGSRGSNGVILITTKRGETGRQRVTFGMSLGMSNMKGIDLMSTSQYVEMANDRAANGGQPKPFPNGVPDGAANTAWLDVISQTGFTQEYSLSVSGGSEDGTYRISGNYLDEEGTLRNSGLRRGAFRVNLRREVGNLTISPQLSVARVWQDERGNAGQLLYAFSALPLVKAHQENGEYTTAYQLAPYAFSPDAITNPLAAMQLGVNKSTSDHILGNVDMEYRLTDGLTAQVTGGVDVVRTQNDDYTPKSDAIRSPIRSASEGWNVDAHWLADARLTFDQMIGKNHEVSATAVASWEKTRSESLSGSARGFVSNTLKNNNLSAGAEAGTPQNYKSESTLISYVGRVNYTLMDRYLLTLSGRIDGSSVFGKENKWGFFPSVAFAWKASEEHFFQNIDQISNLKLRFSWGATGNQAIAPYQTLATFVPINVAFNDTRQVGLGATRLPSPELQWESTEQFNVGLNVGLFNQRVTFAVDAYSKETKNLLAYVPLPPSSGFGSTLRNIGQVQNRGIEFQFDATILTGDFQWALGGNVSANRNEVEKLARGSDITSGVGWFSSTSIARLGEPIGSFFGHELADPPLTENGYFNYKDQDGDGDVDSDDQVIIGNPYPDFVYGLSTEFRFKNFNLSVFAQGEQGKEIFSLVKAYIGDSMFRGYNQLAEVFSNRWTQENQNRYAEYPAALSDLNKKGSEWLVEDASYLRIKNVRLGYSLPVADLHLPFQSADIFVSAQNLAMFTSYEFFSPDSQSFGGNSLNIGVHGPRNYPFNRTYTFGMNLVF